MEQVINGKMNKKLLQKTLKYYMVFSLGVMLFGVPLFFFITQWLYLHETDEALVVKKEEFVNFYLPQLKENEIAIFNKLSSDLQIENFQHTISKDTLFNQSFYHNLVKENEPYRVLKAPISINKKPYTFSARINLVDNSELAISIMGVFTIILIILLIGLFIITKRLSLTLWKPFYETLQQIEKFEIDKNSILKLNISDIEEFSRLNHSINNLIERNTSIYKSQREFIENAAHELQTPIAIFKGKLENILQRKDLNSEQFKLIDDLNNTTSRLVKLNKNLLVLSKIDSNSYHEIEKIKLSEIINNQLSFFSEQALSKKISISTELSDEVVVNSNHFLAEMLISNLFLNTINHNELNGQIIVKLNNNSLSFSNTGILLQLQTEKMFERFSKSNPSSQGNGLGLSIIKKIVDTNHWRINYHFANRMHTFEIVF
ncbi:MAG: HAMP domain-containing histidine kinase [Flavobacterium sp.]|nr:HAMP domain-containing histidine kinase [Flavobacterium sp.]